MNHKEFKKELSRKMQDIANREIWQTATRILNCCDTTSDNVLKLEVGKYNFLITYNEFPNQKMSIVVDSMLVFEAEVGGNNTNELSCLTQSMMIVPETDPYRCRQGYSYSSIPLQITRYISGKWLEVFVPGIFQKANEEKKKNLQEYKAKKAEEKQTKELRSLTEKEINFAKNFGINTEMSSG